MRLLPLMLLALALAAPAAAQAPSLAAVEVDLAPAAADMGRGDTQVFAITVRNSGATPWPANVTLSLAPLEPHWSAKITPDSFQLAGGESGAAELVLQIGDQTPAGTGTLNVTAVLSLPLGLGQATAHAEAQVTVELTAVEALDDALRGHLFLLALLALVLAVLLVLALALRRRRFRLEAEARRMQVPAGGTARYALRVHNLDRRPDAVELTVHGLPTGWTARVEPTVVRLPARAVMPVFLELRVPAGARGVVPFSLQGRSRRGGGSRLELDADVVPAPAWSAEDLVDFTAEAGPSTAGDAPKGGAKEDGGRAGDKRSDAGSRRSGTGKGPQKPKEPRRPAARPGKPSKDASVSKKRS